MRIAEKNVSFMQVSLVPHEPGMRVAFEDKDWRHKSFHQIVRGHRFPGASKMLSFSLVTTSGRATLPGYGDILLLTPTSCHGQLSGKNILQNWFVKGYTYRCSGAQMVPYRW